MNMQATILVVDDEPQNIDILAGVLEQRYSVRAVTDGPRALEIAARKPAPDLILLDIMMPGMDGIEVCRKLKADVRTRSIPVIFVTAMGDGQDEERGFAVGSVDYITKPIRPVTVLARVRAQLRLADHNRELEREVWQRTQELRDSRLDVIHCLGKAAEYKDDHTGFHVERMSRYSRVLAEAAGLPEQQCQLIYEAAPMHDIGKIGIPDAILKKPGPLNAEEWAEMQRHVEYGLQILGGRRSPLIDMARLVVSSHHERWDGSGYPTGLSGQDIPVAGRIVAIADVFDALTSERSYKKAWTFDDAVRFIQSCAGSHFDPKLVDLMDEVIPEFLKIRKMYRD